ncbi:dicarboxylic amino acid permease, partial [Aureobasidium melanogenum]
MSKLPSEYKAQADAIAVSLFTDQDVGTVSNASFGSADKDELQRNLKPRHLQMIAIGGVIGTGLFLGTGSDLAHGGPAGLLIGYCIMASLLYSVMVALGEMISHLPIPGGQFALVSRFVSPAVGFSMGWLYWYNYIVVLPAELLDLHYWHMQQQPLDCHLPHCGVGEIEYWFCSIKALTIIGLIITGIVVTFGGGPDGTPIGFRYWNESGGFVQYQDIPGAKGRFLDFFSVLINAAFAFIGTEITAITAVECANPKRAVPNAIKSVWIRLVLFYLSSAFIIGLIVSPHDPDLNLGTGAAKSPFVLAMKNAGISVLPSIINAALLTSAWSAGCADLFVSSRALYGLASRGQAPAIFRKVRKDGLPWVCVACGSAFALVPFMAGAKGKAGTVFGYFSNMTAICDGLSVSIIVTIFGGFTTFSMSLHSSSVKDKSLRLDTSASLQRIVVCNDISAHSVLLGTCYRVQIRDRSKFVKYEEMEFSTGSSADIPNEAAPPGFWGKVEEYI